MGAADSDDTALLPSNRRINKAMRKRVWITCAVLFMVCLLLLLLKPTQNEKIEMAEQNGTRTNPPAQPEQPRLPKEGEATRIERIAASLPPMTSSAEAIAKTNTVSAMELEAWQTPIEFYGKVLDENSDAVAGAKISFQWVEIPSADGKRSTNVESSVEGLFSLLGQRGPSLMVSVSKEGYYASRGGEQGFKYGIFGNPPLSPEPQNPVVFHLRKKGRGAQLITSENGTQLKVHIRVPKDNTPVQVDLLEKKAVATGHLEISQKKPPWRDATEWSFRMSIPNGGFVENADEFQFEAPETNYEPMVEYQFNKSDTNWTTHVTKQFYIAFGQPRKYGWLRIESDLAQETIFLTYGINPSGSRNLEPVN